MRGTPRRSCATAVVALAILASAHAPRAQSADEYLSWSMSRAEAIGRSMFQRGRVGGVFDTRILSTNRAYNYRLAATWLTPDVIRATARLVQLRSRLSDDATRALVQEAEAAGDTVALVEIDPREGSGVIPPSWEAFLQPRDLPDRVVAGTVASALRNVRALAGTMRRNYDYDQFWVVFPLTGTDGAPLFPTEAREAELVVRIHDKEGRVRWTIPDAFRRPAAPASLREMGHR
jgi:hypothetical protein